MTCRTAGVWFCALLVFAAAGAIELQAQGTDEVIHRRGRIWEDLWGYGMIGNEGAWDYLTSAPLGMFPGFRGFTHPVGSEFNAINSFANANMHNFKSGIWILGRDLKTPGQPPNFRPTETDYDYFAVGASGSRGVGDATTRAQIVLNRNYMEEENFNPLLPEESSYSRWHTNMGVTVTRRTYVWSYPGYSDFIIYDYILKNTGQMVSRLTSKVVPNPDEFQQTLRVLNIAFHSAISVSTKSTINFHSDLTAVQAGAFGWKPPYHDFYHVYDDGALLFSTNYNGGKEPPPWNPFPVKDNQAWKAKFGDELMSPAAFGWVALHASSTGTAPRASPKPDILRIDTHKGGLFQGQDLDIEFFKTNDKTPRQFFEFATTPDLQNQLGNNGDRFNFFTLTYGPYNLAPGDSLRFVLAEIAGVMDYNEVIRGDPEGHFPDSTVAAIRRNAELARNAVKWGFGANVDGIPLAADAPEPPPAPETDAVNASRGAEEAVIAVTWDDVAEQTSFTDGSGGVFYDGASDLDAYRVYRSTDFQYSSDTEAPVLRGAAWTLIREIPRAEFSQYWDAELGRYKIDDTEVDFGRRYGYYVAAVNSNPRTWTSANMTQVDNLPELASGSHRRTEPTSAMAGPVESFDVYAVPNPYVFGHSDRSFGLSDPYLIEFRNLPERASIRIYTVSGDLVRTLRHGPDERGNLFGTTSWDQRSDSGLLVAPGLYVFHVESQTEGLEARKVGKLMIIR